MTRFLQAVGLSIAVAIAAGSFPAYADPPGHAKQHKGGKPGEQRRAGDSVSISITIGEDDRRIARDYYGAMAQRGHCPPGLSKKNNGCLPPGQAKKWALGRPLPRDVIFHDLPHDLNIRLSLPPQGHRYVRVAADILLIAVGTGLVVGAIEDLMSS